MEYRRYSVELAPRRATRTLARPISVALALSFTVLIACDRQPDRPLAPTASAAPVQTGVASYYARSLAGKPTASGEPHEPNALTAASRSLPLGATAKVTNTKTGQSVTVEVNDRGPYVTNRILDVSRRAAERLGFKHDGLAQVTVQPLEAPEQER